MQKIKTHAGVTVSYTKRGSGPPLVLVHGAFSDHHTNWEFVEPILRERFTLYAIARRGRGDTDATQGHSVPDEIQDVVAVIRGIGEPVFLLGHSYGAHCSLGSAAIVPECVRRLVLYEPAWPGVLSREALGEIERLAAAEEWDQLAVRFFCGSLFVPEHEIAEIRDTEIWTAILADAAASLGDLRALHRYAFKPEQFETLSMPVLLQAGSERPRHLYATDALAVAIPDARVEELHGAAHEAMTTHPVMYAGSVTRFLLGEARNRAAAPSVPAGAYSPAM